MRLDDGAFCHEIVAPGERASGGRLGRGPRAGSDRAPERRGRSLRYSLIVLIGSLRALAAGLQLRLNPAELKSRVLAGLDSGELWPGDLGLLLWADSRSGLEAAGVTLGRLEEKLSAKGGLERLEGIQLSWIAVGCASALAAGCRDARGEEVLGQVVERLITRADTPSSLFRHSDAPGRGRFPHFATQIYGVHALAEVARLRDDRRAASASRRAADRLLELQLPDGAWPWIFDVKRGRVVEPYRLYSVHQDAMAPMALAALSEVTGEPRYREAALHGFDWIWGANELGRSMLDREAGMLYRSINRRGWRDRLVLWGNALAAYVRAPLTTKQGGAVEVERTDRPYHLGWVLEAWCGQGFRLR
jgi:hypothetical protein